MYWLMALAAVVALFLLVTGRWRALLADLLTPSYRVNVKAEDVEAAQARWQAKALSSYRLIVVHGQPSLRGAAYQITVRNGEIVAGRRALLLPPWTPEQANAIPAEEWDLLDPGPSLAKLQPYTIPGLFEAARQTIERGPLEDRCDSEARITFDPEWSFPTRIEYAWDANCEKNSPELWAVVGFVPLR
ncbi:MAG: hypothetical protein H5T62_12010 [Anaerolineae bacterium]|nr:hypothetical protein [Anaerolineae bacterium]